MKRISVERFATLCVYLSVCVVWAHRYGSHKLSIYCESSFALCDCISCHYQSRHLSMSKYDRVKFLTSFYLFSLFFVRFGTWLIHPVRVTKTNHNNKVNVRFWSNSRRHRKQTQRLFSWTFISFYVLFISYLAHWCFFSSCHTLFLTNTFINQSHAYSIVLSLSWDAKCSFNVNDKWKSRQISAK